MYINSALQYVIKQENPDINIVKDLLNHKDADPSKPDEEGICPIHYICKHKELDILNLFIEKGIDLKVSDNNGMTPLYYAIQSNWNEGINILKKHNINMIYDDNKWIFWDHS